MHISLFDTIVDFEVKERLESIHIPVCISLSLSNSLSLELPVLSPQVMHQCAMYSICKLLKKEK